MFAADPVADAAQIASHGNVRVTVLTDRLLRIEYSCDAVFEDRPTLAVVNRRFPVAPFEVRVEGDALTVDTGRVRLHCADVTRPFTGRRLHASIGTEIAGVTWRYGQVGRSNLGGTTRTLDAWKGTKTPRAVGFDPEVTDRVPFDITDPRFVDAYFRLLHHPEEDRGVDFWWMDWQQGSDTLIPGLDPLAWLNRLHWDDQVRRRPNRRPLIFSRWGGLGAGRYPIGFSGDTFADWASLAYQPEFTATAANVLYGCWSHDIGGHFGSSADPELYTRWVQLGVHSPVLRTHGTLDAHQERRLWEYPNPYRDVMIDAVRRRYELVPYVYSECRRGVDTGLSLVRPMYHEHPDTPGAYDAPSQYYFGDRMVVAPATRPVDDDAMAGVRVWLPEGQWFDVAHGARQHIGADGGEWLTRRYLLSEVPVFVRAGTVVPSQRDVRRLDAPSYPNLVVTAYPGGDGEYELYEDDGTSTGYERGRSVWLPLTHRVAARQRRVTIGSARGTYRGWRRRRPVEVTFAGEAPPKAVRVGDRAVPWAPHRRDGHWWYDAATASVVASLPRVDLRQGATVVVERPGARARREPEALIAGYAGLARRLDLISESTRTLLGDHNRQVIRLSQAVDRITRAPSTIVTELRAVRHDLEDLDPVLERAIARWLELQSLHPKDPPRASETLEGTRRLLTTSRDQLLG